MTDQQPTDEERAKAAPRVSAHEADYTARTPHNPLAAPRVGSQAAPRVGSHGVTIDTYAEARRQAQDHQDDGNLWADGRGGR
jgi:hypothetical protein